MMASLDKLPPTTRYPKGRYKVRYKKPDGTAGSKNFVRREEAVRFQQSNGADIDRGDWIDPKVRRSKFDSWAASYERSLLRPAPSTSRRYRQYLHNQVLPFFAGRPIASIDYQDVEDFIAHLFEKTDTNGKSALSPKTVRDAVSVLSQVMNAALKVGRKRPRELLDVPLRAALVVKERHGHGEVLTTTRKYGHLFEGVEQRLATDLNTAHQKAAAARGEKGEVVEIDRPRKTQS